MDILMGILLQNTLIPNQKIVSGMMVRCVFALRSGDKVILGVAPIFIEKDEQWQLRMFKELKANLMAIRSGYLPQ